jgi:hypothetical protein
VAGVTERKKAKCTESLSRHLAGLGVKLVSIILNLRGQVKDIPVIYYFIATEKISELLQHLEEFTWDLKLKRPLSGMHKSPVYPKIVN